MGFTYAKEKRKTKSIIGPFRINEEIFDTAQDICGKLSEQYVSSFSSPDPRYKIDDPKEFFSTGENKNSPQLEDIYFTKEMIVDVIKDIKNNSAPGTDPFPAILLKECAEELSEPLFI